MLNDNEIIQNTRILPGDGCVEMRIHLPGDQGEYVQKAQSVESAQKNIIVWCENVRAHMDMLRIQREEEQADAKRRRQSGVVPIKSEELPPADATELPPPPVINDPLTGLEGWLEAARRRLKDTDETIGELTKESNLLRDKIAQYEQVQELIGDPNELPETDAVRTGDTEEETDDREEAERVRGTGAQES
jgi:hypothetical protein